MGKVEDGIRVWGAARIILEEIRSTLDEVQVVQAVDRRIRNTGIAWEEAIRYETVRLMAQADNDGSVGWIVDGRFYFRVGYDDIRSMKIANL